MIDDVSLNRIRTASRKLVRELGFLNQTIAGTRYSASAVHAIIEIGLMPLLTAKQLSEILMLEKSTISRLVRGLVKSGEISELKSDKDGREKFLKLTKKGENTLREIHDFGNSTVEGALGSLDAYSKTTVMDGLEIYASALAEDTDIRLQKFSIEKGIEPGLIASITELHADYYSKMHELDHVFEAEVAANLSEFTLRFDKGSNQTWYVKDKGKTVASVTIDSGYFNNKNALLRWFIVDEKYQSLGLGSRLMKEAMTFCNDHNFKETHLWTFKGLDAARKLYERNGFNLKEETQSDAWGKSLTMQRFVRK